MPKNLDLTAMYNNTQILLVTFYKNLDTVSQNLKEILIGLDQPPLPHATSFPSLGSLFGRNGKNPVKLKYGFSYLCLPSLAPLGFCGHTVIFVLTISLLPVISFCSFPSACLHSAPPFPYHLELQWPNCLLYWFECKLHENCAVSSS